MRISFTKYKGGRKREVLDLLMLLMWLYLIVIVCIEFRIKCGRYFTMQLALSFRKIKWLVLSLPTQKLYEMALCACIWCSCCLRILFLRGEAEYTICKATGSY